MWIAKLEKYSTIIEHCSAVLISFNGHIMTDEFDDNGEDMEEVSDDAGEGDE